MAAPAVQNLNDVIASLTTANQPILDNLGVQDTNITNSATAGVQGIDAAKTSAFSDITGQANARGALFSGFAPDAQAKYTASTYLPALAKLQQSITDSRTALAGQKAQLLSGISTQAGQTVQGEKTALQQWQDQQDQLAATQAFQEKQAQEARDAAAATLAQQQGFTSSERQATQSFQAGQSALDRSATAAAVGAKASAATPTQPQYLSQLFNSADANGVPLWKSDRATENVIIPQLAQNFGLTIDQARTAAYAFRKQYYENQTVSPTTPILQDKVPAKAATPVWNGTNPLTGR